MELHQFISKILSLFVILLFVLGISLGFRVFGLELAKETFAQSIESDDVTVSATIAAPEETPTPIPSPLPEPTPTPRPIPPREFFIYGYGPAGSLVRLTGIGVFEQTEADEAGYFVFGGLSFPTFLSSLAGYFYPELCLVATDDDERLTQPTCIAPLPLGIYTEKVGPILLSPTLSIERNAFFPGELVRSSGKVIPGSEVEIRLARQHARFLPQLIPQVSAYTLPTYRILPDKNGNFEFNLPSTTADIWRVYATANLSGAQTPRSNILTFSVKPQAYKVIQQIETISKYIKPSLYLFIILLEILIIIALLIGLVHINRAYKAYRPAKGRRRRLSELQKEYARIQAEYVALLKKKGLNSKL